MAKWEGYASSLYTYHFLLYRLSYDTNSRYLFFGLSFQIFCLLNVVRVFLEGLRSVFLVVADCRGFCCWITVLVVFVFVFAALFVDC